MDLHAFTPEILLHTYHKKRMQYGPGPIMYTSNPESKDSYGLSIRTHTVNCHTPSDITQIYVIDQIKHGLYFWIYIPLVVKDSLRNVILNYISVLM